MSTSSIVTRSAQLLDIVCTSAAPLAFTDMVRRSGLPKSSVHRLLSILLEERLLEYAPQTSTYAPGQRLVGWSAHVLKAGRLVDVADGPMQTLCTHTGCHVALSVLDGQSVLYLRTVEAGEPYRHAPGVGERSPLHASAAGKILLAMLPEQRQAALLQTLDLERYTEHTITDRNHLREQVRAARDAGFAVCDREEFLQVSGLSVPIHNHLEDVVGAISLWHTGDNLDLAGLTSFLDGLREQAGEVSLRLGYRAGS